MHNNKRLLRRTAEGYGYKTHWSDTEYNDTAASSGKKVYRFLLSVLLACKNFWLPLYMSVCNECVFK